MQQQICLKFLFGNDECFLLFTILLVIICLLYLFYNFHYIIRYCELISLPLFFNYIYDIYLLCRWFEKNNNRYSVT